MTKKDIRCPICNKKFFVTVGKIEGTVEIKCDRCKIIQTIPLTGQEHNGRIEPTRVS
jgi:phage FluMu protein Com